MIMTAIILFDGVCNLCNNSVQFIIKRDTKYMFSFASLQSDAGQRLLQQHDIPKNTDSFILIENGKVYDRSTAALRICKHLKGFWKLCYLFIVIPKPIRDCMYQFIAKNRYKWFGTKTACMLPTPDLRKRFLD